MLIRGEDIAMAALIMGTMSGTLITLVRLWVKRLEARDRARALPNNVDDRLLRIEQAVDAIALEVERTAESQRFTSKILAERLAPSDALPAAPLRKKLQ
jgi:hypothetical protein